MTPLIRLLWLDEIIYCVILAFSANLVSRSLKPSYRAPTVLYAFSCCSFWAARTDACCSFWLARSSLIKSSFSLRLLSFSRISTLLCSSSLVVRSMTFYLSLSLNSIMICSLSFNRLITWLWTIPVWLISYISSFDRLSFAQKVLKLLSESKLVAAFAFDSLPLFASFFIVTPDCLKACWRAAIFTIPCDWN